MQHNHHSSRLTASGVALGCHSRCTFHHKPDPSGIIALIRRAIDSGVSLIDCASGPSTELIVRKAIARQDIPVTLCVRSPSRSVRKECENSLRRLGVDRIDLYYLSPVAGRPIEYLVIAAAQLIETGKIAHIGLSDVTADQLRQAQAIHPIAALVTEYSLLARQIERTQLAAAREANMTVIACRPLAGGRLTSRLARAGEASYRDRPRHARQIPPAQAAGTASQILAAEQTAADLDLGLSRLALAWLLAQGPDIIPVAGTCDQVHLEMNLAAAAVRLPPESLARLSAPTPRSAD